MISLTMIIHSVILYAGSRFTSNRGWIFQGFYEFVVGISNLVLYFSCQSMKNGRRAMISDGIQLLDLEIIFYLSIF